MVLFLVVFLSTRNLDAPNTIREYSTADKTPNEVDTFDMFELSGCPLQDDPASNEGPWCEASDICLGTVPPTCVGPKWQSFLKTDYYGSETTWSLSDSENGDVLGDFSY